MKAVLGALSVGSGLALAAAPHRLAQWFGLPRYSLLARGLGVRDMAIGLRLLERDRRSGLAARAVADLLDFGLIWRERRHRPDPLSNAARLTAALFSAGLASGLRFSVRPARHRRLLREAEQLLRRRPALALGAAFLLGVTAARVSARRSARSGGAPTLPGASSATRAEQVADTLRPTALEDVEEVPISWDPDEPLAGEAVETTGVGSPIGDAPYAGGSRH